MLLCFQSALHQSSKKDAEPLPPYKNQVATYEKQPLFQKST